MTKIHFGFTMPADQLDKTKRSTYLEDLHRALNIISGHFDSIWIIDHLQSGNEDMLEGFTALTYMAARHPEFKFGHTVLCQSFRNPALVAKMSATLQFLSGGHFVLGMGAGWDEEEFRSYGYDFPPAGVRVEQLEEALQIIRSLWTEEQATFEGRYHRVNKAFCEPKPVPLPPIMVGAFRPKMLRIAAKYADWWNVSSTSVKGYQRILPDFERACMEVGRDPKQIRRSWCGGCVCAPTLEAAKVTGGVRYNAQSSGEDFDFVGTPEELIRQMRPFIDLGVDYFMLDCGGFPNLTTLELLVSEVLPVLND